MHYFAPKDTFLDSTANALAEQTKYNDLRYAKKGETSSYNANTEMNITVINVQPEGGLWFDNYAPFFRFATFAYLKVLDSNAFAAAIYTFII